MGTAIDDGSWYEGDHLEAGHMFLKKHRHNLSKIWAASAGLNAEGRPQILAIGFNHVQLIDEHGETFLDVGPRDLRTLRSKSSQGLEVCTTRVIDFDRPQRSWTHLVSDEDAQYPKDLWISLTPFNDDGMQLNPLPWREDEYAYYVGRVVTESAKCDVALAGVAMMVYSMLGWSPDVLQGKSGNELGHVSFFRGAMSGSR